MKIALYSDYLNHHQLPLALAINKIPNVEYIFVANTPFNEKRISLGYKDLNSSYDFVLRTYESKKNLKIAHDLARDADIVMVGCAPISFLWDRIRVGKTAFRPIERLFKEENRVYNFPRNVFRSFKYFIPFQNKKLFFLAASAYLAADANFLANYKNKVFRWAYFTECKEINCMSLEKERIRHDIPVILWVGRFLKWKHPECPIYMAKELKKKGYKFKVDMIGGGEMKDVLVDLIKRNDLEDCVSLLGTKTPEEVRLLMEQSDIFLLTSDSNEGWGAVLNESMSSGCAVVASHACGSSPFLIKDGENGFMYKSGNTQQLQQKVELLLNDVNLRLKMGRNAFNYIREMWSAELAAERLIDLSDRLANGLSSQFVDGPCSPSPILRNNWY